MNHPAAVASLALAFGTILEGGFYAGRIRQADGEYALIVAPKAEGDHDDIKWGKLASLPGALSFFDGRANTAAMAERGSKLAKWALELQIGGHSDWYLPSRDELELCYRNLKPGAGENWCYGGDNPSSVPVGYAYLPKLPAQTEITAFRIGGVEAFEEAYYWSSTQFAGNEGCAWNQSFGDGYQYVSHKDFTYRARAVRRLIL